jgi:hypothetical protein
MERLQAMCQREMPHRDARMRISRRAGRPATTIAITSGASGRQPIAI